MPRRIRRNTWDDSVGASEVTVSTNGVRIDTTTKPIHGGQTLISMLRGGLRVPNGGLKQSHGRGHLAVAPFIVVPCGIRGHQW